MNWLNRHSSALQALGALVTAVVAVIALVGVKFQIDASYRVQREQSAKEIYRELLNISIANPDYAAPDYCALKGTPKQAAYESYVDYMLYTAEQVIDMDPDWSATIERQLNAHKDYLCSTGSNGEEAPSIQELLGQFRQKHCDARLEC